MDNLSELRLHGVSMDLVKVVRKTVDRLPFTIFVVEGLRSLERQKELYAQGRTKPGRIVTKTMNSKHIIGHAVDLAPFENGKIDWSDSKKFDAIALAMFASAAELGVNIRWGANWDQDKKVREKGEDDSPHFELV